MEILNIKNVSKNYDRKILDNINLKIYKGEIVSVLGESGSGKSTLLNIIGGLDSNYSGEIYFKGVNIRENESKYRRDNVGFIFQNFNLIPYLNLVDNVALPLMFSNMSISSRRKKATIMLEKVGLKDYINKNPNEISGGQKQRVAIARALINNPKILICDEPTGSLDSKNANEVLNIFIEIAKMGKTVIIATHSKNVSKISHRTINIIDGKIEKEEILNDFLEYYEEKELPKKNGKLSLISSVFLAYKNSFQKKFKTFLVSIGTSIGLIGLAIILSLSSSVKTYINDIVKDLYNDNIIDVYKEKQDNIINSKPFTNQEIDNLKNNKLINNLYLGYINRDSHDLTIDDITYNFDVIKTNSNQLKDKHLLLGFIPKENEILINSFFYNDINENIEEKTINFKGTNFIISGVYEDGMQEKIVYFNYKDIESLLNIKTNVLYLKTNNIMKLKNNIIKDGYFLSYIEESLNIFNETFDIFQYILSFVSILSLIISSIMIMIVLHISVLERTREIGLFGAIGGTKKEISRIFKSEGIIYGIISGTISILCSIFVLVLIDYFINKTFEMEISSVNISYIITIFIISISMSLLSSHFPSKKASKLNIIDSLRYE